MPCKGNSKELGMESVLGTERVERAVGYAEVQCNGLEGCGVY